MEEGGEKEGEKEGGGGGRGSIHTYCLAIDEGVVKVLGLLTPAPGVEWGLGKWPEKGEGLLELGSIVVNNLPTWCFPRDHAPLKCLVW